MTEKTLAFHLLEKFTNDREKMERYVAIAQLCPLPAFIVAHDAATVVYVNPAYTILTGRVLEELQDGKWIDLVIHPEDRTGVRELWGRFALTTLCPPHRHRYVHKDGKVTEAISLLERVEGNGFVGFIIPSCTDPSCCPLLTLHKLAPPAGLPPAT
jgi:PAS domain S-box-containing protein